MIHHCTEHNLLHLMQYKSLPGKTRLAQQLSKNYSMKLAMPATGHLYTLTMMLPHVTTELH